MHLSLRTTLLRVVILFSFVGMFCGPTVFAQDDGLDISDVKDSSEELLPPEDGAPTPGEVNGRLNQTVSSEGEDSGAAAPILSNQVMSSPPAHERYDLVTGNFLIPYNERRPTWAGIFSVGYSTYNPLDYKADFVAEEYADTYYENPESPLIEVSGSVKLNISFFSVSADVGIGYYSNEGRDGAILNITPVRASGTLALDNLFSEPYVVPYASLGAYVMWYKESLASQSVNGRTSPGLFIALGSRFQLDWLDKSTDLDGFIEHGIENTFLFIEARQYGSTQDAIPDLSSPGEYPFQFGGGLAVEF